MLPAPFVTIVLRPVCPAMERLVPKIRWEPVPVVPFLFSLKHVNRHMIVNKIIFIPVNDVINLTGAIRNNVTPIFANVGKKCCCRTRTIFVT
jgi:hypothetical protein